MKIGVVEAELWSVFSQPSKPGVCWRTLHNVTSVTQFHRYQKSEDNVSPRFLHSIRGTKKFWVWVKNLEDYPFESWFCLFLLVWRWLPSCGYRPRTVAKFCRASSTALSLLSWSVRETAWIGGHLKVDFLAQQVASTWSWMELRTSVYLIWRKRLEVQLKVIYLFITLSLSPSPTPSPISLSSPTLILIPTFLWQVNDLARGPG